MADKVASRKERAYEYVRSLIESGELGEGDRVGEVAVSEALGISRTPVREALIQLAGDGYLTGQSQRGFRVRSLDEQSAREVFEMLGPLDGRAALLACERMSADDLVQMRFLHESMELALSCGLTERYFDLQLEFHGIYYARCGNERLRASILELYRLLSRRSYKKDDADALENLRKANAEHLKILELFERKAARELQDYVRDVHWSLEYVKYAVW